jgi:hypothetical protein
MRGIFNIAPWLTFYPETGEAACLVCGNHKECRRFSCSHARFVRKHNFCEIAKRRRPHVPESWREYSDGD